MTSGNCIGKKIEPYLYLTPAIIFIIVVFLYPVIAVFQESFLQRTGEGFKFVGIANYKIVFKDSVFWGSLQHNLTLFICVPIIVFFSIIFSVLLHERTRGWRIYRSIAFLPYVLSIVVVGIVFSYIFQYRGILNTFLKNANLSFFVRDWLGSTTLALPTMMVVIIWRELGFGIVLFLARLTSINEELFEAAKLDGASWWQTVVYVTVPQLRTIIEFYFVFECIQILSWVFDYVYVMTQGGPGESTYVIEYYIYKNAFTYNSMQIATTAAAILFLFVLIFMFVQFRVRKAVITE